MPVLGVGALLDRGLGPPGANVPAHRGLGPPGANVPARCFACVLRVFCESVRERERERELERE